MTTRLENLRVDRVALVDRGADQDADIVMFKRLEEEPTGRSATSSRQTRKDNEMPDDLNLEGLPTELREHFKTSDLSQDAIDAVASAHSTALDAVPEATATELVTANAAVKRMEDAMKSEDDNDEEDKVTKGLSDEASAMFKRMTDENTEMKKTLDASIEKQAIRDYTEVAKVDYKHTPGADPSVMGPILYRMEKNELTDEDRAKLNEVLQASSQQAHANTLLTQELGKASTPPNGAEAQLETITKSLQAGDSNLTYEQAYAKALETAEGKAAVLAERAEQREREASGVFD